jgi:hypothetical protein
VKHVSLLSKERPAEAQSLDLYSKLLLSVIPGGEQIRAFLSLANLMAKVFPNER